MIPATSTGACHPFRGDAARRLAHGIKGAAANVSGPQMRELAWMIEQLGRDEDLNRAAALLPELSTRFERMSAIARDF
jgi:HPt (histidine-containing phosphotransfer) domain-containing protein